MLFRALSRGSPAHRVDDELGVALEALHQGNVCGTVQRFCAVLLQHGETNPFMARAEHAPGSPGCQQREMDSHRSTQTG